MFGIFKPKPRRWGGRFRIERRTYGDGRVKFVVQLRARLPRGGEYWDRYNYDDFPTLAEAEAEADRLYGLMTIKWEVVAP